MHSKLHLSAMSGDNVTLKRDKISVFLMSYYWNKKGGLGETKCCGNRVIHF